MEGEEECVGRGEGRRDGGRVKEMGGANVGVGVCGQDVGRGTRIAGEGGEAVGGTVRVLEYSTVPRNSQRSEQTFVCGQGGGGRNEEKK